MSKSKKSKKSKQAAQVQKQASLALDEFVFTSNEAFGDITSVLGTSPIQVLYPSRAPADQKALLADLGLQDFSSRKARVCSLLSYLFKARYEQSSRSQLLSVDSLIECAVYFDIACTRLDLKASKAIRKIENKTDELLTDIFPMLEENQRYQAPVLDMFFGFMALYYEDRKTGKANKDQSEQWLSVGAEQACDFEASTHFNLSQVRVKGKTK